MKISSVLSLLSVGSLAVLAKTKDGITLTGIDLDEPKHINKCEDGKCQENVTCPCANDHKQELVEDVADAEPKDDVPKNVTAPKKDSSKERGDLSPEALKELSVLNTLIKDDEKEITPEEVVSVDKRGELDVIKESPNVPQEDKEPEQDEEEEDSGNLESEPEPKEPKHQTRSESHRYKHVHEYEYLRISDMNSEPVEKVKHREYKIKPNGEIEDIIRSDKEETKTVEHSTPKDDKIPTPTDEVTETPEDDEASDDESNSGNSVNDFVSALKSAVPALNTTDDVELKKDAKDLLSQPFNIKEVLDAVPTERSGNSPTAKNAQDGDVSEGGALRGLKSKKRKSKKAKKSKSKSKKAKKNNKKNKKDKKEKKDKKRKEIRTKLEALREQEDRLQEQLEQEKERIRNAEGLEEKEKSEEKRLERELERCRKNIEKLEKKQKKEERKERQRLGKEKKKELRRERKRLEREEKKILDEEDEEEELKNRRKNDLDDDEGQNGRDFPNFDDDSDQDCEDGSCDS